MKDVRRIVHLDMDAFYASVEQRDRPEWKGYPLVVAGDSRRGVVAAASYEARRFGIRSAMPVAQALKLCPEIIRVPPRFSAYKEASSLIHAVFHKFTDKVEPIALDESFLDLTEYCATNDIKAGAVALEMKRMILESTRLTASAGVGPNKLVAKIASGFKKPDGLTIVPPDEVEVFMAPLSISKLWGVGPVTQKKFHELGIFKVGELATWEPSELRRHFGRHAESWRDMALGRDDRPVEAWRETKSISAEQTFNENVTSLANLAEVLVEQADEVAHRLQKEELEAYTVQIKLRYPDFTTITRSKTFTRGLREASDIAVAACRILEAQESLPPIRLIGLGLSGLQSLHRPRQLELEFED